MARRNSTGDVFKGILVLLVLFGICIWICSGLTGGCMPEYSSGLRAGTIQKFSEKGLKNKSGEGVLDLGGVIRDSKGGLVPNLWQFSVTDSSVIKDIDEAALTGERVSLHYHQGLVRDMMHTDTPYVVYKVERNKK